MHYIASPRIAISPIIAIIISASKMYVDGHLMIAYALFAIPVVWAAIIMAYLRQQVEVEIYSHELLPNTETEDVFNLTFEGFIKSRHPEGLKGIGLWVHPCYETEPLPQDSIIPDSINSTKQKFRVHFSLTYTFIDQTAKQFNHDGVNTPWILSVDTPRKDWLFAGPTFSTIGIRENMINWERGKGNLGLVKERREGIAYISKDQFMRLVSKATQCGNKSKNVG